MRTSRRSEERVCTTLAVSLGDAAGKTRNVSASGLFVETDVSLPLGAPVSFAVALDNPGGGLLLKGRGEVVRVEQGGAKVGMAIRITQSTLQLAQEPGAAGAAAVEEQSITRDTQA